MSDNQDKDGAAKNLEVLKAEWSLWFSEMKKGLARFKDASLKFRDKNNVFHLIVNLIEETYDSLPRTFTYITIILLVAMIVNRVVSTM